MARRVLWHLLAGEGKGHSNGLCPMWTEWWSLIGSAWQACLGIGKRLLEAWGKLLSWESRVVALHWSLQFGERTLLHWASGISCCRGISHRLTEWLSDTCLNRAWCCQDLRTIGSDWEGFLGHNQLGSHSMKWWARCTMGRWSWFYQPSVWWKTWQVTQDWSLSAAFSSLHLARLGQCRARYSHHEDYYLSLNQRSHCCGFYIHRASRAQRRFSLSILFSSCRSRWA